jgi:hypothetical protein
MRHLRYTSIALLLALAFFFNVERLDFGGPNEVNLHSFVYPLAFVITLIVLTVPWFVRTTAAPPILLWLGSYLFWRLFVAQPISFTGIETYIYITEIVLPVIVVWIAHRFSRALAEFEAAVEDITLEGIERRPRPLPKTLEATSKAVKLCRRYGRPLSVLVIDCDGESAHAISNQTMLEVQRAIMQRYSCISLTRVLDRVLRASDMVMTKGKARFVIVCPETDQSNCERLADRIKAAVSGSLGVQISCASASLPGDALTLDELVHSAEKNLQSQPFTPPVQTEPSISIAQPATRS